MPPTCAPSSVRARRRTTPRSTSRSSTTSRIGAQRWLRSPGCCDRADLLLRRGHRSRLGPAQLPGPVRPSRTASVHRRAVLRRTAPPRPADPRVDHPDPRGLPARRRPAQLSSSLFRSSPRCDSTWTRPLGSLCGCSGVGEQSRVALRLAEKRAWIAWASRTVAARLRTKVDS